jgi:hypothetical protein
MARAVVLVKTLCWAAGSFAISSPPWRLLEILHIDNFVQLGLKAIKHVLSHLFATVRCEGANLVVEIRDLLLKSLHRALESCRHLVCHVPCQKTNEHAVDCLVQAQLVLEIAFHGTQRLQCNPCKSGGG